MTATADTMRTLGLWDAGLLVFGLVAVAIVGAFLGRDGGRR